MGKLLTQEKKSLELNNGLIKQIYQHVNFLANFRYKNAISILQSKHIGYETEDFVQEVLQEITRQFKTKKFPTINHLKSFINLVMEFHYLKEKRKYFFTKSRGPFTCVSLDDDANDYRKIEDTLSSQISTMNFDLHNLLSKKLYISYDWKTIKIIKREDFKSQKSLLLSVNKFIELQIINGLRETCKIYKNSGFYMTKTLFNQFSQAIIDYAKRNDLLVIEDTTSKYKYDRTTSNFANEQFSHLCKTCICGYTNDALTIYDDTWQCPNCGKLHSKNSLIGFNSELSSCSIFNTNKKSIEEKELSFVGFSNN